MQTQHLQMQDEQLKTFFQAMHGIWLQQAPACEDPSLAGLPQHRLRIYQQGVAERARRCLEPIYTAFPSLLGPQTWQAYLQEFEQSYPLREIDPNKYAQHFVAFLAEHRAQSPWLSQLAELEWNEFAVATGPVQAVPAVRRHWICHPTLVLMETTYPVGQWLLAWRKGDPTSISLQAAESSLLLLFASQPGHYTTKVASPGDLLCLHWLRTGCTLEQLAQDAQCSVGQLLAARQAAEAIGLLLPPTHAP